MFRGPHLYSMTPMVRIRIGLDSAAADDLEHLALYHDRRVFINAEPRTRGDTAPMTRPGALPSSPGVDATGVTHSNIAKGESDAALSIHDFEGSRTELRRCLRSRNATPRRGSVRLRHPGGKDTAGLGDADADAQPRALDGGRPCRPAQESVCFRTG